MCKREPAAPPPSLPRDLVADVLSRLPVSSVARLKTVCKQWCSLTSDPIFIRVYSCRANHTPSVMILTCPLANGIPTLRFTKCSRGGAKEVVTFPNYFSGSIHISCSNTINGLICIHDEAHGFIFNPLLRQSSSLPKTPPLSVIGYLGLGCNQYGDVYKVILHLVFPRATPRFRWAVSTLGTGKGWRFIDDCDTSYMPLRTGVDTTAQLHGVLYLIASRDSLTQKREESVFSFDVKDEKFVTIPTPSNHYGHGLSVFSSTNSKEYLCYVGQKGFEKSSYVLDICLLQDDGTWITAYSIDRKSIGFYFNRMVGMVDGNLFVSSIVDPLKCYDRKSKTVRYFGDVRDRDRCWITIYNDSIVSPMMGTEEVVPT